MSTVEVSFLGENFAGQMNEMRGWLDHRHLELRAFRQFADGEAISCRLGFAKKQDAIAFADAFGGRVLVSNRLRTGPGLTPIAPDMESVVSEFGTSVLPAKGKFSSES
jgi:hypothetical protein